jgi:hypothetical protein
LNGKLKKRAANLSPGSLEQIVNILDGWEGKLTWDGLIEQIFKRTHQRYTRQALHQHAKVADSFQLAKKRISKSPVVKDTENRGLGPTEAHVVLGRIKKLEAENERLKAENARLDEKFVVWCYNAYLRGISENMLEQPLPSVNRSLTKMPPARFKR